MCSLYSDGRTVSIVTICKYIWLTTVLIRWMLRRRQYSASPLHSDYKHPWGLHSRERSRPALLLWKTSISFGGSSCHQGHSGTGEYRMAYKVGVTLMRVRFENPSDTRIKDGLATKLSEKLSSGLYPKGPLWLVCNTTMNTEFGLFQGCFTISVYHCQMLLDFHSPTASQSVKRPRKTNKTHKHSWNSSHKWKYSVQTVA